MHIALLPLLLFLLFLPVFASAMVYEETTENIIIVTELTNKDLATGYINNYLYPRKNRAPHLTGTTLPAISKNVYSRMRTLVSEVAAGERTSTIFQIPFDDIMEQTTFTAEELDVDDIAMDGAITQETKNAVLAVLNASYNATDVVLALLADSPYELYWFDKGSTLATRGVGYKLNVDDNGTESVTLLGYIKLSMSVAEEYVADVYEVDPKFGQGVHAATENAKAIVDKYEDYDPYDRLLAYKDAICELTSYNYAALNDTSYGNPWQLIWVFDGDEETNVVCEGYAKAFQYLNDLSSSTVTVISPQGYMNGESHMWNIVTMDNGINYLVDVTNCDSGMAGYPDKLFLVGAQGSVDDGFTVNGTHYTYSRNIYSTTDLSISKRSYLEARPHTPVITFSSRWGYSGYGMVLRLDEEVDAVLLDDEVIQVEGNDIVIWTDEVGDYSYYVASIRDGFTSDTAMIEFTVYGEPDGTVLRIPDSIEQIEEEAFSGIQADRVVVHCRVDDRAFADSSITLAEIGEDTSRSAFEGCEGITLAVNEPEFGFSYGLPFIVRRNEK